MTDNQSLRVTPMQLFQQHPQGTLLCFRPCVARRLAVSSQTADITYPDRMPVMVSAVSAHHILSPTLLNGAVSRNHIMIATTPPS